ncbi:hypothetical protein DIPPA_03035 [Diplonema papillatum]|nr:hypothetical protein DIPPA_03035 [Diplonema papillatum]
MGDVEPLCPLVPPDKCGWLEMKTMLGWAARWCEFRGGVCQLIRSHEREDRTTRKLSDLRNAVLRLERGHSSDRYIEAAYARSPEEGTRTLRLRTASAPEAKVPTVQQVVRQSQSWPDKCHVL